MATLSKHAPSFPLIFRLPPPPSVLLIGKQQFHLPAIIWKPPGKYSPISSISILCQLIWGIWGRIPIFCSRGLFCFSIARQIRPLPRYTLHIHPPKRLQAFLVQFQFAQFWIKQHIQAKYRNSLKIAPAQICFAPYPRYPQNVLGRFRKSKNKYDFEKIQN